MLDVLILGSGPAAWSCAMTARKRNLSVTVAAAQSTTSWLWRTDRVDNYPGMPEVSGKELLTVFRRQAEALGTQVIEATARQIQKTRRGFMVLVGNDILTPKAIVLATGAARPKLLPGEEELLGSGVSWCGTCDGMFYRGKTVAVCSAWDGGLEEADFLSGLAAKVDYYILAPHTTPTNPAVTLREGTPKKLTRMENGTIAVETLQSQDTYDGVFLFRPAVAPDRLLPGLAVENGAIVVNRRMATSVPMVYACGDCTGAPLQIAKAVGEGNVAAISAAEDIASEAKA